MTTYVDFNDHYESGDASVASSVGTAMNWAGAGLSLVLIVGLGVWGYNLLMRDVTGVPVVRALEGPMRITPEDPGGVQADYQELSVTRVAVAGAEEDPADEIILAPEPIALTDEDLPAAELLPVEPEAPELSPAFADETHLGDDTTLAVAPEGGEPTLSAIELAIAEALGQSPEEITVAPEETVRVAGLDLVPASVRGVATSPRPMMRPATLVTFVSTSTGVDAGALDLDPATLEPGTRLVQLGAFPTPEDAVTAWDALAAQFGDYMDNRRRVIQEAQAGGKTFYRLRAHGYEDLSDARRFCAVLVAGNANCIPVLHR